ncbi:MAG TPA: branched-chain amino acid ABC transporter permease/ATP-binding protein [Ilumatobacteraceae bacterium]|nr:branched-chain amino acid ABC transporter permease/ATP-binding protein [Ilumatobacteraceae bacterium]
MTIPGIDFEIPTNVVILGLITGLTYSLIAVGLTLVYRTTRVLNFSAGEMGALPAVLIPVLVISNGWPYWLALPLALAGSMLLGGMVEAFVIRPMSRGPRLTMLVATIGLAQAFFGINLLIPRGGDLTGKAFPVPFDWRLTIGSLVLGPGQLLILVAAPACIIALSLYLERSPLGKASRASAENSNAARLAGVPIGRVSFNIWAIAGLFAGIGAVLAGATRPLTLSVALGPALLLRALGAAMVGGLRSIWGAFAGGIGIGIVEALIIWNYPVGGVLEVVLAGLILASMLVRPALGRASRRTDEVGWTFTTAIRPLVPDLARKTKVRIARGLALAVVLALAVLAPLSVRPSSQVTLTTIVLTALMGLSLVVLTGYAGHVSLGQYAFVGIGAAVGGRLYQAGVPHLFGAAIVVVIGAVIATVIGLPALRMGGLFLSVATLGFALATSSWLFFQDWLVHESPTTGTSMQLPRPEFLGVDFNEEAPYYWLCLAVLVLVSVMVYRLRRSGPGRAMIAVRDNERSAASLSLSPRRVKLTAFAVSGAIASLAGFLYGGLLINFSNSPGSTFGPAQSLALVVTVVFGGITSITGAVLGSLWIIGIPRLLGDEYALLSSGFAVVLVLLLLPGGLASVVFSLRDRLVARLTGRDVAGAGVEAVDASRLESSLAAVTVRERSAAGPATRTSADVSAPAPIAAEDVSVRFGGLHALRRVSVVAERGEILGLMGPNGAGKTTLFDVLSGNLRPAEGTVRFNGRDVTALPSHRRARLGLGRTYQQANLFGDLTTLESVAVSLEHRQPSFLVPTMACWPPAVAGERRRCARAAEILDLLGLGPFAHRPVSQLPTGLRRLAELGCVIALEPDVLLLDEPTAGFTPREIASFTRVIHDVRDYLGATIIVIDHDVPMMRDLVERLYVLAAGVVIAEGPPSVLDTNAEVAEVYLGSSAAGLDRGSEPVGVAPGARSTNAPAPT